MFITPIFETLFFFFSCIAVGPTVVGYWGHAVLAHVDRVFLLAFRLLGLGWL